MNIKKNAALIGLVVYALSVVAFFIEFLAEVTNFSFFYIPWDIHELFEILIITGLITGFIFVWNGYKASINRQTAMEFQLQAARGELQKAIEGQFASWQLSEAEKDIALLTIKGMSIAEIAELRSTAEGTIKTQSSSIYKKAKVKSRSQLVSVLIEELLE